MGFPSPSGNALLYYKDIKASAATEIKYIDWLCLWEKWVKITLRNMSHANKI